MVTVGYARLSLDKSGEGLALERQREDMTKHAAALGWSPIDTFYEDNDKTADPKKKVRPAFQRLLTDIRAGAVHRVLCYDQDRLVRDMRELEDIADAVEAGNVELTSVNGDIDLRTDNGLLVARIKAAVARNELDKISRRTTRQKQQRAESGLPMGTRFRVFGYTRDWELVEDEAAIVREVFERAAKGESVHSITKDLIARGVTTAAGHSWKPLNTSRLLRYAAYAGINVYKGEVIGKMHANFPVIVSETLFTSVQPTTRRPAPPARKYLLSGILVCGKCLNPMSGNPGQRDQANPRYRCDHRSGGCGGISIRADWVEKPVLAAFMHLYHTEHFFDTFKQRQPDYASELATVDARIAELQQAVAANQMELEDAIPALKVERTKRAKLMSAASEAESAQASRAMLGAFDDWEAADLSVRRAIIGRYIKHVVVSGVGKGRQTEKTAHDRLVIHWVDGRRSGIPTKVLVDRIIT